MGEKAREVLKLQFDKKRLRLEFNGAGITEDAIGTTMLENPRRLPVGE